MGYVDWFGLLSREDEFGLVCAACKGKLFVVTKIHLGSHHMVVNCGVHLIQMLFNVG